MRFLKMRSEIELDVRALLHDPNDYDTYADGSDARWNRETMLLWLNRGIEDIRRKRPEARLNGRDKLDYSKFSVLSHTNDSYTILDSKFHNLIINYIVWKCYSEDDVDAESARKANEYQAKYYGGV